MFFITNVFSHQIGESHVDVQRTASKDETGTACRNFAPNKQCIGLCFLLILMSYLLRTNLMNNLTNETISERMIETSVVRQKTVSQCCNGNITCYKCNRTYEQFSRINNNVNKCSIDIKENSKFLPTKISESRSICSRQMCIYVILLGFFLFKFGGNTLKCIFTMQIIYRNCFEKKNRYN